MNPLSFRFEFLTPGLCGGADRAGQAEVRPPSIRGQLRWWLRTLGGFTDFRHPETGETLDARAQERLLFGSAAGHTGEAGRLRIQASDVSCAGEEQTVFNQNSPPAYLFSQTLRDKERRAWPPGSRFTLRLNWRGAHRPSDHLAALIAILAHFGALGARSRRGLGALAPVPDSADALPCPAEAISQFKWKDRACFRELKHREAFGTRGDACLNALASWLQDQRHHGQLVRSFHETDPRTHQGEWTNLREKNPAQWQASVNKPRFPYARRDHNEGLVALGYPRPATDPKPPAGNAGQVFRAALGLPILQQFSSLAHPDDPNKQAPKDQREVIWGPALDGGSASGRFASPVLLRPHRDATGKLHGLVIFVDSHKWPDGTPVYLNHKRLNVSLALYDAMKSDPALQEFPL